MKYLIYVALLVILFLSGCAGIKDALSKTPDAWLHPPYWDEQNKTKQVE